MRRTILAAVVGLAMALSGPAAHAQNTDTKTLGVQAARLIFQSISFETLIAKELGSTAEIFGDMKARPEWGRYLVEALQEEVAHDLPYFEQLFGEALAKDMSAEELQAGVTLLSDPALQRMIKAASEDLPEPNVQPSRETERVAATRAGRAFLRKMERIEERLEPVEDAFAIELVPGAFRRFADKAEAGEAARRRGQTVK